MDITNTVFDLCIIGGGINGCGIAVDAAGRGLSVILCEQNDLASGTSSASTKLIHGGLRYLESYEFFLVRKALMEREVLMHKAPFLIHPLPFIIPYDKALHSSWMIKMGLFLYDHLSPRSKIPASNGNLNLDEISEEKILRNEFHHGARYYDCWTDDSRLVILNAMVAAKNGAKILTRTEMIKASQLNDRWKVSIKNRRTGTASQIECKVLINASGPWVDTVDQKIIRNSTTDINKKHTHPAVQLVKGSHIIVPRLYQGEHAYLLQHLDNRVIFTIPFHEKFTLIGTTDIPYHGNPSQAQIDREELFYLCEIVNHYFQRPLHTDEVIHSFSGVRPLYTLYADQEQTVNPSKITRDYHLEFLHETNQAALLTVYGGKLTTYRVLAQTAVEKLRDIFPDLKKSWTAEALLPGGDLDGQTWPKFQESLVNQYPQLPAAMLQRYAKAYGSLSHCVLRNARTISDLGQHWGADLYQCEIDYWRLYEWAETADDMLWRRSKLQLFLSPQEREKIGGII